MIYCYSLTCIAALSLLSSLITSANASGFTPASINFTHIDRLSESRPVFSKLDISIKTMKETEN